MNLECTVTVFKAQHVRKEEQMMTSSDLKEDIGELWQSETGADVTFLVSRSSLALAEQHDCAQLKAKCLEFITEGSAENLDAVVATEDFNG